MIQSYRAYKNLELIIVGDHCTDNTAELLSTINPRLKFIIFHQGKIILKQLKTTGLQVVRRQQMPLAMASGQWIARVDDDDTWTKINNCKSKMTVNLYLLYMKKGTVLLMVFRTLILLATTTN